MTEKPIGFIIYLAVKENKIFLIVTILAFLGVILASYLFVSYLSPTPPQICNLSSTVNCDAVTKGNLANFLGIPVSLIGLIGYIVILISSMYRKKGLLLFMTSFGMLFCLRLTILEIFVEKVICPVCLACQTIILIVFLLSLKIYLKKNPSPTADSSEEKNS